MSEFSISPPERSPERSEMSGCGLTLAARKNAATSQPGARVARGGQITYHIIRRPAHRTRLKSEVADE